MSNSHLFVSLGFPRAPLKNGIGRYICQLKRVTLKFCKSKGDSKGIREFIESELIDFAKANPGVVVYLKPRRHRAPHIKAEFLNGQTDYVNCHDMTKEEVNKWLKLFLTRGGREVDLYKKLWHTANPSIQGVWSPFTHRDPRLNVATFPLESNLGPINLEPSATEQLIEIFKKQQLENKIDKPNE